jgi:hypothetical protein
MQSFNLRFLRKYLHVVRETVRIFFLRKKQGEVSENLWEIGKSQFASAVD